jgi:hypothetical protein
MTDVTMLARDPAEDREDWTREAHIETYWRDYLGHEDVDALIEEAFLLVREHPTSDAARVALSDVLTFALAGDRERVYEAASRLLDALEPIARQMAEEDLA